MVANSKSGKNDLGKFGTEYYAVAEMKKGEDLCLTCLLFLHNQSR